jgi:predicted O-linked N-acetylglucosamine transferase (SPINDLY family)
MDESERAGVSPLERYVFAADDALAAGRLEEARAMARRALDVAPDHPAAHDVMRAVLMAMGREAEALPHARRALQGAPEEPSVVLGAALVLIANRLFDEGLPLAERAMAMMPGDAESCRLITRALLARSRFSAMRRFAEQGLRHAPRHPGLTVDLAAALAEVGRTRQAERVLDEAASAAPGDLNLALALCCHTLYADPPRRALVQRRLAVVGRLIMDSAPEPPLLRPPLEALRRALREPPATGGDAPPQGSGENGRVRVALLSSDLKDHSVAFFLPALLRHLDRERFELHVLALSEREDWMTAHLKRCAAEGEGLPPGRPPRHWHVLTDPDSVAAARRLRALRPDMLIELNAVTDGHRLDALRLQPAPIMLSYLGYPVGTGLPGVVGRIVDHVTDPPASADDAECLLRLDGCFVSYEPPSEAPPVLPPPCGSDGPVTFGSFNRFAKVNESVLESWAALLQRVPGSRLLLKSGVLGEEASAEDVRARLRGLGLDPSRVEFIGWATDRAAHLRLYARVDIALDTFPYAGTTTTCEALYMGVPVVTLAEESPDNIHAGRVGASLLRAAGLHDLIATDRQGYIRLAAALAEDRPALAHRRATQRDRLRSSALCDGASYARRLSDLLWHVWAAYGRVGGQCAARLRDRTEGSE